MVSGVRKDVKSREQGWSVISSLIPQNSELRYRFVCGWPKPNESLNLWGVNTANDCLPLHSVRAAEGVAQMCF